MNNPYSKTERKFLKKLGNHIRNIRLDLNLSQENLAFNCELDRTYIGSVERGERNISILNIEKISKSLGVKIYELLNF